MFPVPSSDKRNPLLCYTSEGDLDMVGTLREGLESGENPILVLQDLMRSEDDKINSCHCISGKLCLSDSAID